MQGPVTIDASVFLNAFNTAEEGHAASQELIEYIRIAAVPIICPMLLLPEVSATISRGTANASLAREFTSTLEQLPHMMLVPLDEILAVQAVVLAAEQRLRGSDAVYAATALRYASMLITLDREMHERAAEQVRTRYPSEVLSEVK